MDTLKLELELTRREADLLLAYLNPAQPHTHFDLQSAVAKLLQALTVAGH